MQTISRRQLKKKLHTSKPPVVIEVLQPAMYRKFHLPGAINVPLDEAFESEVQAAVPDKNAEVVVYCSDADCDASPTAAQKLDDLGYRNVMDYAQGKQDWRAAGLAVEVDR